MLNDYHKACFHLLEISKKQYMEVKRLRILGREFSKTLNELKFSFHEEYF